ncbi:MAG TPA: alpha/beta hydrolase [Longimicrobium sp.]|nr:alpha/beta hydrolase [Longimicrobium sp.]
MLHYRTHVISPDHEWVVFVHGAGGSSSIWHLQVRAFRRHFNVLLVDLRGHGESQGPHFEAFTDPYTFESVSRDVLEVLDHLEIRQAHFVGISLGTILIRTLGEIAPERVKSMILGGAITRLDASRRFLVWSGDRLKRLVPFLWLYRLFAWIIMPRRRHRESRMLFVNEARKLARKEFLRWFHLTLEINPLLRFFEEKEVPIPTLYLMGDEDHIFLPPVRRLAARHRSSELEVLERSGHVCNVDRADLFNRTAIDFIHRISGHPSPHPA